eukprot:1156792-Amphidinium_carterae.1
MQCQGSQATSAPIQILLVAKSSEGTSTQEDAGVDRNRCCSQNDTFRRIKTTCHSPPNGKLAPNIGVVCCQV